ncbi:MAG: DegV family protein [Ruminococcus sp.]|nr:DegV family protein [Ruminococcus sp.]
MSKYAIIADASCDLGEAFQKEYDIRVIFGHLHYPQGEVEAFLSWDERKRDTFYKELSKNPDGYSTAPPNVEEFKAVFLEYAQKGEDVLCITISGGISGACDFATQAKNEVLRQYPNARIIIIDSLRFSIGHGLLVILAAKLRAMGRGIDEVGAYLEDNKNRIHQCGWLDDLSFVAKKGRLTHSKAFFGKLAGVKPIGEFDYNGLTTVIGKVKGAKKAYSVLLNYIENTIENPSEQTIFIAQTSRYAQAEKYQAMIRERFKPKEVIIVDVFPFCGINIGPGLMAAYYIGKPISKGLTEEKTLVERLIKAEG